MPSYGSAYEQYSEGKYIKDHGKFQIHALHEPQSFCLHFRGYSIPFLKQVAFKQVMRTEHAPTTTPVKSAQRVKRLGKVWCIT